jgi:hypothetical protein
LYIFISIFWGSYIESYEIVFSSAVMGEFINTVKNDFFTTSPQLFNLGILSNIVHLFDLKINLFGWFLVVSNFLNLLLFSILLYEQSKTISTQNKVLVFLVLILILFENILNLSSTRIAVFGCFNIFLLIRTQIISNKFYRISTTVFYSFILSTFRFEVVILTSAILFVFNLFYFKTYKISLLTPLVISILIMLFYNIKGVELGSSTNKIFYYFENLSFFDNNNLPENYYTLKEKGILNIKDTNLIKESLKFSSIFIFGIHDKSTFNENYINLIIKKNSAVKKYIFGRINLNSFILTFESSIEAYKKVIPLVLLIITVIILISIYKFSIYFIAISLLFVFLPILLNLHIETPLRFLSPYYLLLILTLFIYYGHHIKRNSLLLIFTIVFLIISFYLDYSNKLSYEQQQKDYNNFQKNLETINPDNDLVVIEYDNHMRMISRSPFSKPSKLNVLFLNEFIVYKSYFETWSEICQCDPYSLKSKIEFIGKNNLFFVYHSDRFEFIKLFLQYNFNTNIIECGTSKNISDDLILSEICIIN